MFHMEHKLDKKDLQILEILKNNSEYTTREIARKTLLPVTTIHNRIKKMRKTGVIKKYTIEPDYKKINKGFLVYVLITANLSALKEKKRTQYDLADEIKKFHFVEKVDITTGGADLVVVIRVKDVEEFNKVLLGKLQLVEGIDNTRSLISIYQK